MSNFVLSITVLVVCCLGCATSIALFVLSLVNYRKSHKRLTKEERIKAREEAERVSLANQINKLNSELAKLNAKKK